MSDLGTRSRKGMRDGISSLKECPENGSRSWESRRRQTQLRNVGRSVRQTCGGWKRVEGEWLESRLEIWRENSQFRA